eukprot:2851347-Amphidinium_carterae.1
MSVMMSDCITVMSNFCWGCVLELTLVQMVLSELFLIQVIGSPRRDCRTLQDIPPPTPAGKPYPTRIEKRHVMGDSKQCALQSF